MEEMRWYFSALTACRKGKSGDKLVLHNSKTLCTFPFLQEIMQRTTAYFPHQNKCFINYVFCWNWAVKNPAWTRLDSLAWQINNLTKTQICFVWIIHEYFGKLTKTGKTLHTMWFKKIVFCDRKGEFSHLSCTLFNWINELMKGQLQRFSDQCFTQYIFVTGLTLVPIV